MFSQRDIVLVPFPYSDLSAAKQRPALIISNNKMKEDKICCLITSVHAPEGIEIRKGACEQGSLPFESWVKAYRLFTVNDRIIRKKLCRVTPKFHERVLASLNDYVNIEANI